MPRLILIRDMFAPQKREIIPAAAGDMLLNVVPPDFPTDALWVVRNGKKIGNQTILSELSFNDGRDEIILRSIPGFGLDWGVIIATAIVGTLISTALSFAISALTPKPKENKPTYDGTEESPVYGWDGIQNTTRNGSPIALVYGVHRQAGQILAAFTTAEQDESANRETKTSVNTLHMLLGLCAGPIGGINDYTVDTIEDLTNEGISSNCKINTNDASTFDAVSVSYRMGNWVQSIIPGFNDTVIQYTSGTGAATLPLELAYDVAQTYLTNDNIQAFELLIRFASGLYKLDEQASFLQYGVDFQVRYREYGTASWTDLGTTSFSNKTRSQYTDSIRVDNLAPAQYEIEVTRETADDATYEVSSSQLIAVNEINYDDTANRGVACVGVKAIATEHLNGRQPTITNIVYGKECAVYQPGDDFGSDTAQDFALAHGAATGEHAKLYFGWYAYDRIDSTAADSNRANIEYAKSHSIAANKLSCKHISGGNSTFMSESDWDAPFFYKKVYAPDGFDVRIKGDFLTETTSAGDALALAVVKPGAYDTDTNYLWIGLRSTGSPATERIYVRDAITDPSDEYSWTAGANERYFRIEYDGSVSIKLYSSSDGSSWTLRHTCNGGFTESVPTAYIGPAFWSTSGSPDIEVEFSEFAFADSTCYSTETTHNPAWVVYDLLTDENWGIGNYLNSSQIDLDTFIDFAAFCNTQVADGKGGTHRKHRCDVVLDSAKGAWEQIIELLANSRAIPLKQGDKIRVAWQREQDPVQLFTMSNIKEGSFVTTYQTPELDANYWELQFLNQENQYEQDFAPYVDPDIGAIEPYRRQTGSVYGITRPAEALRESLFRCKKNRHVTQSCSFEAGIDAICCEPFDVISVQHDCPSWGVAGRVKEYDSGVRLDKSITLDSGYTYQIRVRHNDDSLETHTITNAAGLTDLITIEDSWTTEPSNSELYVVGRQNILVKDFLVLMIERTGDLECKLECVEYVEDVYDDEIESITDIVYTTLPDPRKVPGDVSNLVLAERAQIMKDGTAQSVIDVTFSAGRDAESYEIFYREVGFEGWLYGGSTRGLHFILIAQFTYDTSYEIAVVSVGPWGAKKKPHRDNVPTQTIFVQGNLGRPSNVSGLKASRIGDVVIVSWDSVSDNDLWLYELRYGYSSTTWDGNASSSVRTASTQYHVTDFVEETYYFLVKAINRSGLFSETAAYVQYTVPARPGSIFDVDVDERSGGWAGTKTYMEVDSGDLALSSGYTAGSYTTTEKTTGTATATGKVECHVTATVEDRGLTFADIATWTFGDSNSAATTFEPVEDATDIVVTRYFRYGNTSPLSGDWTLFQEGMYTGKYFQFKVEVETDSPAWEIRLLGMYIKIDTGKV